MTLRSPLRRALTVAAALAPFVACAQAPGENRWAELVPPGWNPMAGVTTPSSELGMLKDSDPQVLEMMERLRAEWDRAPTREELDQQRFRLSGYVVPIEQSGGAVTEFLLVPYFGACIHSPPPPANQIVHVVPPQGIAGLRTMDVVTVQGTLRVARSDSTMGVSGYRIEGAAVQPYQPPSR